MGLIKNVKILIKKLIYKGNKFTCPFCGFTARSLAPIGLENEKIKQLDIIGAGLRYAGCHICGSTDRERLIYLFLTFKFNILKKTNLNILHIAPEKKIKDFLSKEKFNSYICGDKYCKGYNYDNDVINLDITHLHFENSCFDLVICNHVLEHIYEDNLALKELNRVLKSDGVAILQVPISYKLKYTFEDRSINTPLSKLIHFGQEDHVRIYGEDYFAKLDTYGFEVQPLNIYEEFPNYGLNIREDIFYCKKKSTN